MFLSAALVSLHGTRTSETKNHNLQNFA